MKCLIHAIDVVSPVPSLRINGSYRFSTLIGGLVSLMAHIFIVFISIYFALNFLYRIESAITYTLVPNVQGQYLDLNGAPYMMLFTDFQGRPLVNASRYFSVSSYVVDYNTTGGSVTTQIIPIKNEKCNLTTNLAGYVNYFYNFPFLTTALCAAPGQKKYIRNTQGDVKGWALFYHDFNKCTNNTLLNKTDCYDDQTINNYLNNFFIAYATLSYSLDHLNVDSPGNLFLKTTIRSFTTSSFNSYYFIVKGIQYDSDMGLVFESIATHNYFVVPDPYQTTDLRTGSSSQFGKITYSFDSGKDYYRRNFVKAQAMLANVGGIIKAIILMAQIVTYLFNTKLYYLELVSSVFNVNNSKKLGDADKSSSNNASISPMKNESVVKKNNFITEGANNLHTVEQKKTEHSPGIEIKGNGQLDHPKVTNLKISLFQVIIPLCCLKKASKRHKENYEILKAFIESKLCIKHILTKINDFETINLPVLIDNRIRESEAHSPLQRVNNKPLTEIRDFKNQRMSKFILDCE